jgi:hypothetical protein
MDVAAVMNLPEKMPVLDFEGFITWVGEPKTRSFTDGDGRPVSKVHQRVMVKDPDAPKEAPFLILDVSDKPVIDQAYKGKVRLACVDSGPHGLTGAKKQVWNKDDGTTEHQIRVTKSAVFELEGAQQQAPHEAPPVWADTPTPGYPTQPPTQAHQGAPVAAPPAPAPSTPPAPATPQGDPYALEAMGANSLGQAQGACAHDAATLIAARMSIAGDVTPEWVGEIARAHADLTAEMLAHKPYIIRRALSLQAQATDSRPLEPAPF